MKHTCAIVLWTVLVFGTSVSQAQPLSQGTIHFSTQQYAVSEAAPMATITVNLDRRDGGEAVVAVQCYTINGTATEEDYEPVNTAVAFAPPLAFAPQRSSVWREKTACCVSVLPASLPTTISLNFASRCRTRIGYA